MQNVSNKGMFARVEVEKYMNSVLSAQFYYNLKPKYKVY